MTVQTDDDLTVLHNDPLDRYPQRVDSVPVEQEFQSLEYLVIDLETTGPDSRRDDIIEIAAVGLDRDLTMLFEFESLVEPRNEAMDRMLDHEVVLPMHVDSGLLEALDDADKVRPLRLVEDDLLALIEQYSSRGLAESKRLTLAGSGVSHFDIRFLKRKMPGVTRLLRNSTFDVSGFRIQYRNFTGVDLVDSNQHKTHRAMDDVMCHIEEMRAFRSLFLAHANSNQA